MNLSPEPFELPLFPLQSVLFPDGLLALKVFEARYLDLMGHDKKVEGGHLKFILLDRIGSAFVDEAPRSALAGILDRPGVHA